MSKLNKLLILPILLLTSCNDTDPSVSESIINESIEESVDINSTLTSGDFSSILNNSFKMCDGIELSIENSNAEYISEFITTSKLDNTSTIVNDEIIINEANVNLKARGLKTATTFNELKASAKASANVTLNYHLYPYTLDDSHLDAKGYLKDGNVYLDLNDDILSIIDESMGFNNLSLINIPENIINDILQYCNLTLPIVSNSNFEMFKSLFESDDNQDDSGLTKEQSNALFSLIMDNIFTIKYLGTSLKISVNINKANIITKADNILTGLYENDLLPLFIGTDITEEEYNTFRDDILNNLEVFNQGFSHFKMSVSLKLNSIESISFDVSIPDFKYSYEDENNLYNYNFTFNSKINISFKYNDYVTVLYPDLLNYTVIEGLFD